MSATDVLRKLSPEDIEDLAKHIDKSLHKHKSELQKHISEYFSDAKGEVKLHEKKIPTGCKILGLFILVAASALSYFAGRKLAD